MRVRVSLIAAMFLATGTAHAGDLAAYRKPICETAEDFAVVYGKQETANVDERQA